MDSSHRAGNIRRIKLENFLTYNKIEVWPSPHLNVVIGPNTTGKSSILCAICIGLAGKPEVTGRGKHISEYIKHGNQTASIEIELHNQQGKHSIIKRSFNSSGKSIWTYNGKVVPQKNIEEGVKKMGIRVDNLCQFLPQDRVSEFAKLDKIDLLSSTEKAVGETKLAEDHAALCSSTHQTLSIKANLADLKRQLDTEIKKNEQIQPQVENLKKKNHILQTIRKLRIARSILQIAEAKKTVVALKAKCNELNCHCKALEKKMEPRRKKQSEVEAKLKSMLFQKNKRVEKAKEIQKEASLCERNFSDTNEAIDNAMQTFADTKQTHARNLKAIEDLNRQLSVLQQQLADSTEIDASQFEMEYLDITRKIQETSRNLNEVSNRLQQNLINHRQVAYQKDQKEKELVAIRNIKELKLKKLLNNKRSFQNVYKAAEWLQNNRDKFKSHVYDPIFSELEVDSRFAKYVEASVAQRDLVAFVCENRDDVNFLKQIADQHGWIINIVHSNPDDPSCYRPKIPIENLRQFGFDTYLKDAIKAPPAVLKYMCKTFKLHMIPAALGEVDERVPDEIFKYFSGNSRFSSTQSRYDKQVSTTVDSIRKANLLSISSDSGDLDTLQRDILELDQSLQNFSQNEITLNNEKAYYEKGLEELRQKKKTLAEQKDERRNLENRIQQKKSQISRREESLEDVDAEEVRMHAAISRCHNEMNQYVKNHCKLQERLRNIATEDIQAAVSNLQFEQEKSLLLKQSAEDESTLEIKKEEMNEADKDLREAKLNVAAIKAELHKTYQINELHHEKYLRHHSNLEAVEKELAEFEAQNECLFMSNDDSVKKEYERREAEIKRLEKEVADKEELIMNQDSSMEETKNRWLPRITELTEKINEHFSSYMEQLDCAGQVVLEKGQNENDFSKYGLGIKVKFRDSEKLSDLTLHQQSGGERSVSTALYLLALQTLTAVPFRCVDEINQGMDATNERKMFTMLVDSTSQENASQYFLVTPKLLPNLPYNSRVTFLNIYNGSRMAPYNKCYSKKILKILERSS